MNFDFERFSIKSTIKKKTHVSIEDIHKKLKLYVIIITQSQNIFDTT